MIVKIDRALEKDVKKIKDKTAITSLAKIIEQIRAAENLSDIQNLKKLKGSKNYYRIRIGDYRLGIFSLHNEVELIRLLHRKEIYRYFP